MIGMAKGGRSSSPRCGEGSVGRPRTSAHRSASLPADSAAVGGPCSSCSGSNFYGNQA